MGDTIPDFSATGSWLVPQQAQLLVDLEHGDQTEEAVVRAVRRLGLAVVVEETSTIQAGAWIDRATLRTEHGPMLLRFLQVQARKPDPFGVLLELRTDDPRSVAHLWSYLYEQKQLLSGDDFVGEVRNYEELRVPRRRVFDQETWLERGGVAARGFWAGVFRTIEHAARSGQGRGQHRELHRFGGDSGGARWASDVPRSLRQRHGSGAHGDLRGRAGRLDEPGGPGANRSGGG